MTKVNIIPPEHFFTVNELKELMQKSNGKGWIEVVKPWLIMALIFFLLAGYTNVFTIVLAIIFLGGQQLACSVIMHDAGHYSLFKSRSLNRQAGNFFGAWPVLHNVEQYGPYHYKHHRYAGTEDDPDINLAQNWPTHLKSFMRKMFRDFSGASGIKSIYGIVLMHIGVIGYTLGGKVTNIKDQFTSRERIQMAWKNMRGPIFFHMLLCTFFFIIGYWWFYMIWWAAYFTSFNFCIRIRSMAEHSMTPDLTDPFCNVRTTYANIFEKLLFAPLNVNYHAEHHLLMGVPSYRYPQMHQMLLEKGYYQKGILSKGYWPLVKQAAGVS